MRSTYCDSLYHFLPDLRMFEAGLLWGLETHVTSRA